MKTQGTKGESIVLCISGQFSIIKNPVKVTELLIDILPSHINIPPILLVKANSPECFKIKVKAFIAAVQNESEVKAI